MEHKIVPQIKTGMIVGLLLIFTLTGSVLIGGMQPVLAQGSSGMESSYESEADEGGVLEMVLSFFEGIVSWVSDIVGGLVGSVNALFGFERGEGSQAMFGGVFYFFLILFVLFAGKFAYNIMRDTVKSVVPKGGPPKPRKHREK